ncbi:unnamed protein product [Lepeophtheirus salmonis]|uniref:(salmon louse) hypothetical protein n=1 Tax=Lepeophtheirus salmonis TaxID=72036 RepID=A0A7R8CX09_LEPSM|nr:unnamed protein product [Lepeophtheirus salmonis]CAF2957206.1 unnamed protein product [Lepeophtheirus salmonis]
MPTSSSRTVQWWIDYNAERSSTVLSPCQTQPGGKDVATVIARHFEYRGVDMREVFVETSDGPLQWLARRRKPANLLKKKVRHPIMKFHSIIQYEKLCAQISNLDFNDATVAMVINFLVRRGSEMAKLQKSYQALYKLSRCHQGGSGEKGQHYPQLEYKNRIVKLMFLVEITRHLNELNLRLQSAG